MSPIEAANKYWKQMTHDREKAEINYRRWVRTHDSQRSKPPGPLTIMTSIAASAIILWVVFHFT